MAELAGPDQGRVHDDWAHFAAGHIGVPVTDYQGVDIATNSRLLPSDLESPASDWTQGPDNPIAPLNAQAVAMSEHEAMVEHFEIHIGPTGDTEHEPAVIGKVSLQVAVDVPLQSIVDPVLRPRLQGSSTVIAHHTRHEHLSELVRHLGQGPNQVFLYLQHGLHHTAVVGLAEFVVDRTRNHVTAEAHNDAGVGGVRTVVVLGQVNCSGYQAFHPFAGDLPVELVRAPDLLRVHHLAPVPITPDCHRDFG